MSVHDYRRNHYVPQWYQHRFIPAGSPERKYYYLDLKPVPLCDKNGMLRMPTALRRWGPARCFQQTDLYTTKFGSWESTEIERRFFGEIDHAGRHAIEYFAGFEHPHMENEHFHALLRYMSTQKLRTPKGLGNLTELAKKSDRNSILFLLQRLQHLYTAIWTESVWAIGDASASATKFIVSDHPVTAYNRDCFPGSKWCVGFRDPEIWRTGTHTIFPLSLDKVLIFTNLSWVRDPYGKASNMRPNPNPLRPAMFDWRTIQTKRMLSEVEVNQINFIIKKRAFRYIAAGKEEWLYPERVIPSTHWSKFGAEYLLMPDPRSVMFGGEILIGYESGRSDAFDEYGHKPWQKDYRNKERADHEWETFHQFQGEFSRVFGPKRRGRSFSMSRLDPEEDDSDYHAYHLRLEKGRKQRDVHRKGRDPDFDEGQQCEE